ncbi:MAG: GNAT family N-acetyltransferase [Gammaproteobacteria bacterium]|nr:GNAT family N-acetyltransferase [Gammaproteobacteria bacterium]MBJ54242.1 GNAT family N-acetyltransferase [Gammaproteobacteria bacterium]|tara:strand:+ start:2500 stop:2973 length:474 start_codon:yes stop_codon:yes gene_type:complete
MQFIFLANLPQAIPTVADWYYQEWGAFNPNLSPASIAANLENSLNTEELPLVLLAMDQGDLLGVVELKYREMAMYPDKEHWLGGMYIRPDYRGRGVGKKLIEHALELAARLGVRTLHLQTEQLDGGLYRRLGWRPVEQINNKGIQVLVMERDICSSV